MFESVDLSFPEHLQQSCPERSLPATQKINNHLFCNQRYFIQKNIFVEYPILFSIKKGSSHQELHQTSLHGQPDNARDVHHQRLLK